MAYASKGKLWALLVSLALVVTCVVPLQRAPAAAAPALPTPPSATPLPTVQIDGVAWQQIIWGDTVYVGGSFSTARPPGAAAGVNTVQRLNLLAFDLKTGELRQGFVADTNAQVLGLTMAPDGSKLYVAGEFTSVNGVAAYRIAALDPATGAVDTRFKAGTDFRVRSLVVTDDTVYAGGSFGNAGGQARSNLAAFRRSDGAVLNWAPQALNGQVMALAYIPGTDRITVSGSFTTLNATAAPGIGGLDPVTGATMSFPVNQVIQNSGSAAAIYSLHTDGSLIYGTGYTFGGTGNFEGTFAVDPQGRIQWINDMWGDEYDLTTTRGMVINVGHMHNDANLEGGVPEVSPRLHTHTVAQTAYATGKLQPSNFKSAANQNYAGQPSPTLLHWWPQWTVGSVTGAKMAGWAITATDEYVVVGGEFTRINNLAQQGLVRFTYRDIQQSKDGPRLSGSAFVPDVTTPAANTVQVSIPANWDRDDATLRYRVQREGVGTIAEYTMTSSERIRPVTTRLDKGVKAGTYRYRVLAIDSTGLIATGNWVTVTVADTGAGAMSYYTETVLGDGPTVYMKLGDASPGNVVDSAYIHDGVATSNTGTRVQGAIAGDSDTAFRFFGNQYAATSASLTTPRELTTEAWVKTTTSSGGVISAFGSSQNAGSSKINYVTYLGNDGKVRFGVFDFTPKVVTSPMAVNDGKWHHVAATLDWTNGMRLFVDGELVAADATVKTGRDIQGYWRVAGDSLTGWPSRPWSNYINATVDEFAMYRTAITPEAIRNHYKVGAGESVRENVLPTASFNLTSDGLGVTVDGSGSKDADGIITGYSWDFGNGRTATGATASNTYAAAGTYTVTLKVFDNDGGVGTAQRTVTVSDPGTVDPSLVLADEFSRTLTSGWGSAQQGGAWTTTGSAGNYRVNGSQGEIILGAAGAKNRVTSAATAGDVDVTTTLSVDKAPTGSSVYALVGTRNSGSTAYQARLRFEANGTLTLSNISLVNNVSTVRSSVVVPGLTYVAGDQFNLRTQVVGTTTATLRAKVWKVGTDEPTNWTTVATDTAPAAALQTAGSIYIEGYAASSVSNAPIVLRVDRITAGPPQG